MLHVSQRRYALLLALLGLSACTEKKSGPSGNAAPEHASPSPSSLAALTLDAGLLGEALDPPAPAGDLKDELARFINVDACARERSKLDPLVGDALAAIGYETFLRDACRMLEAAKDGKQKTCEKIDSSALRRRCESWVAMVARTPEACPMQFEGLASRGRQPVCVAVAARDPRLCAGEARTSTRATCEALVLRDAGRCEALPPEPRARCTREVQRWKSMLDAPLEGLPKLPQIHAKLTLHGHQGTPDPAVTTLDLADDFARGVVVVAAAKDRAKGGPARLRVELGTVTESEASRFAASLSKRPRFGLALLVEPSTEKAMQATLEKIELELPGEAPIVAPPSACDCKLAHVRVASERGGEAGLELEGTLTSGTRSYKLRIELGTFVRDALVEPGVLRTRPAP